MFFLRVAILLVSALGVLPLLTSCGKDHPDLPALSVDHIYVYGEKINFATGGDSHRFRTTGWSDPEPSGTWTDGPAASLVFRLNAAEGPLQLTAKLSPNIRPPRLDAQLVHVYVRGQKIATWRVAGLDTFSAIIPRSLVGGGGIVTVDLHIPGAVSPQELGSGADGRRLGVRCVEMTIAKANSQGSRNYQLGTVIRFAAGQGAERYEVSGWSKPEAEFTWTEGTGAALELRVPKTASALMLRSRMRGISRSADAPFQPTDVYVNGEKVAHWEVGAPAEFQTKIPTEVRDQSDSMLVEFRTPLAISPSQLGANADTRVLGVCVFEIQITATP